MSELFVDCNCGNVALGQTEYLSVLFFHDNYLLSCLFKIIILTATDEGGFVQRHCMNRAFW
jgi:hypothetical protein